MTGHISRFLIKKLHGHRNIDIPISDNRIVLAGVNGLGKTTVATLLYLYLSRQFRRLLQYQFDLIGIVLDDKEQFITRSEIEKADQVTKNLRHFFPPGYTQLKRNPEILERLLQWNGSREELNHLANALGVPPPLLDQMLRSTGPIAEGRRLQALTDYMRAHLDAQILYLPTYRRIEKDLTAIFPELDEDIKKFRAQRKSDASQARPQFVEFVEFGMEDVEETISSLIGDIKERARTELNDLAGGYLRDVIRGEGGHYEPERIRALDPVTVSRIVSRVERTFDAGDKRLLTKVIEKIKTEAGPAESNDAYVAHFFSKLVEIHKSLTEREAILTGFASTCNEYFDGKRMTYDEKTYSLTIQLEPSGQRVRLSDLSSGEKQIVSLFAHLYLSPAKQYAVIIDEPELSLSVKWQKRFLPDLLRTGRVSFLAAVTHSPFVFDNELDPYARNLAEFAREG